MRHYPFATTALICGLMLTSGCMAPTEPLDAEAIPGPQGGAVAGDAAVLKVVFDDMLNTSTSRSPWAHTSSEPVYVSKKAPRRWQGAGEVALFGDKKTLSGLTTRERNAVVEATDAAIARADVPRPLPELSSASGRVRIFEDAGAATQPGDSYRVAHRASHVLLPGYSKDGRYAVVCVFFPWTMHSGEATYVLEHAAGAGWKVLLRDFRYYL